MQSSDKYEIVCVPPYMLGGMWEHCGPLLLRGQLELVEGDMQRALLDLLNRVMMVHQKLVQIWVVIDVKSQKLVAAMTSEILTDTDGKQALWVSRMAGEGILGWGKKLSDTMTRFAKAEGADVVRFDGRKALQRAYGKEVRVIGERGNGIHLFERAAA